ELPAECLKWLTPQFSAGSDAASARRAAWDDSDWGLPRRGQAATSQPSVPAYSGPSGGIQVGEQHFRVGQSVQHARFGDGVILALHGSGTQAQAQIRFAQGGT